MKTRDITFIALAVAFISVSAQIAIPLGQIPFTLQTMVILMVALVLDSKKATMTIFIYILVGAVGVPVFSAFTGGINRLFMQTGGFIMTFPIMAYVAGKISEISDKRFFKYLGCTIGVVLNFAGGCLYFMFITEMELLVALGHTVFPFIITSIIQIILAVELSIRIKKINGLGLQNL